MGILFCTFH